MANLSNNGSASDPGFAAAAAAISVAAKNDTFLVTDALHTPTYMNYACTERERHAHTHNTRIHTETCIPALVREKERRKERTRKILGVNDVTKHTRF